ncbi:MAG: hypothetical protein P8104_01185 [Gammaproteobacteria bacterium]|jgi:hypothetical protein
MNPKIQKIMLLWGLSLSANLWAHDVGLSLDASYLGAADPDGPVAARAQNPSFSLFGRYKMGYFNRLRFAVSDLDIAFDPSDQDIGQEGSGVHVQGQYQRRIDWDSQSFFLGAGLAYRHMEYRRRRTENNDRVVTDKFFDLQQDEIAFLASVEKNWPLQVYNTDLSLGVDTTVYQVIGDGTKGIKFGISIGYNFLN